MVPPDGPDERRDELEPEVTDGGDPVCWVERVCDACGGIEDGPPAPTCPRCGAPRTG